MLRRTITTACISGKLGRFDQAQKRFDIAKADGFYTSRDIVLSEFRHVPLLAKGSKKRPKPTSDAPSRSIEQWPGAVPAGAYLRQERLFKVCAFIQRFDALGQPSPDALPLARNIEVKLGNASAAMITHNACASSSQTPARRTRSMLHRHPEQQEFRYPEFQQRGNARREMSKYKKTSSGKGSDKQMLAALQSPVAGQEAEQSVTYGAVTHDMNTTTAGPDEPKFELQSDEQPIANDRSGSPEVVAQAHPNVMHGTLGPRLRAAREIKGWKAGDVAGRLRLPIQIIQAIEAEQYDKIGHGIYLRGYLKSYALSSCPRSGRRCHQRTQSRAAPDCFGHDLALPLPVSALLGVGAVPDPHRRDHRSGGVAGDARQHATGGHAIDAARCAGKQHHGGRRGRRNGGTRRHTSQDRRARRPKRHLPRLRLAQRRWSLRLPVSALSHRTTLPTSGRAPVSGVHSLK